MPLKGSPVQGPLSGIIVLDLTRVLAGPFGTMILADLGARVIKIEVPPRGDDAREIGPFVGGRSAYFMSLNRGKESLALDLKDDRGRTLLNELIEHADVLVENFRPGVLAKLGYGWPEVHARNPRLIYVATSGFGQSGPYAHRPAYDVVVQAMGGIMSLTGHPGSPPTRVGTSVGDIVAGLYTALGVSAALHHRGRSGEGTMVDIAMLDCQVAILENAIARYCATDEVPVAIGSRHPSIAPFAAFATEDGHVIIACGNDALFETFAEAVGRPELAADPRFVANEDRTRNVDALTAEIEITSRQRTTAHWLEVLETAGVPCGPINDVAGVLSDPQVLARNMIVGLDDGAGGALKVAGNPIKMTGFADPSVRGPAPELDADHEAIVAELAAARQPH